MKDIHFIDPQQQRKMETDGFAVLKLLSAEQADVLRDGYEDFADVHNALNLSFATTSHSSNEELISAVDELILKNVAQHVGAHIEGYELLFSNFLVKAASPDSQTPPHQDVTMVDETLSSSYSIWVALEDIDTVNGCLKVLPGSHRHHLGIRPNPSYPWRFREVKDQIEADMISVPVRKGEALIFSHALIHGSGVNHTNRPRVAAVIALYPLNTELFHYQVDAHNIETVHKYAMDKKAFLNYVKNTHPSDGLLLATLPFESVAVSLREYDKLRGRKGPNILTRLKNGLFGQ